MCGISGYVNFKDNFILDAQKHRHIVHSLTRTLRHRGPDGFGEWVGEHATFGNSRLAIVDILGGMQPMERTVSGYQFVITYNGELYNAENLRDTLLKYGYRFNTNSDTEVVLYAYIHYGADCAEKLLGMYSFCVWDSMRQRVFLCRDRLGIKPLFYAVLKDTFIFASEQKAILSYPDFKAEVSKEGLCQILTMYPHAQDTRVFEKIKELPPSCYITVTRGGIKTRQYYELKEKKLTQSFEDASNTLKEMIINSTKNHLISDVGISSLLSRNPDHSIITYICAKHLQMKNKKLSTYSLCYKDYDKYNRNCILMPENDAAWIKRISDELDTDHKYLLCDSDIILDYLSESVEAKDLPGISCTDSSLLYFFRTIKKNHSVVLSPDGFNELFGYTQIPESYSFFQEFAHLKICESILLDEVKNTLDAESYLLDRFQDIMSTTPASLDRQENTRKEKEFRWLHLVLSLSKIIERNDRMSMASGVEIRMPFLDHEIFEYVYNIPKCINFQYLLESTMKGILPENIITENSSNKTFTSCYCDELLGNVLKDIISNPNAPILSLFKKDKISNLINRQSDCFKNVLTKAEFLSFLIEFNYWLEHYKIRIV